MLSSCKVAKREREERERKIENGIGRKAVGDAGDSQIEGKRTKGFQMHPTPVPGQPGQVKDPHA